MISSVLMVFFSCKPAGPLTAEDALLQMKNAVEKKDSETIVSLLSQESIMQISTVTNEIKKLSPDAKKQFALKNNLNYEKLSKLSVQDYIIIQLSLSERNNNSKLHEAFTCSVINVDKKDQAAVFRMSNGVKLKFVEEKPYWKFDLTYDQR